MTELSIVIPTKDRPEALARTVAELEAQEEERAEIVVIDNGSAPAALQQAREIVAGAERARLVECAKRGPAAARNAGVAAAAGEVLLFLGDDTAPAGAGLLRAHLDLHAARPAEGYGVLGRISWDPRREITPFMRWLENGGPQFAYADIGAGPVAASHYFYSSHASVKRAFFDRVGGFDERFPDAAVEDTELGVRLGDAGLEFDYHPELLVLHDHPTVLAGSLDRLVRVGRSAALYNELRPDRPHPDIAAPRGPAWSALRVLRPAIDLAARLPAPTPVRERLWYAMHLARYAQGYRLGPP